MSRLGKKAFAIPAGVTVTCNEGVLTVTGPKGTLSRPVRKEVTITVGESEVTFTPQPNSMLAAKLWGTYAAHLINMVKGVTEGYARILELEGVGYRAEVKGKQLVLSVGFSHPVPLDIPPGISAVVEKSEPYKGKGIRYRGEFIIRKQGKKAA
jgi:large subunit ribosomal protein L6